MQFSLESTARLLTPIRNTFFYQQRTTSSKCSDRILSFDYDDIFN